MDNVKSFFKSKTFWFAVANALLSCEPHVQELIINNPGPAATVVSMVFMYLRYLTTQPVKLK